MVNQRSVCSCVAMILLGSERSGRMAHMTDVLQQSDAGFWGKISQEDKEEKLPFMWESSFSTWSSAWGWKVSLDLRSKYQEVDKYE